MEKRCVTILTCVFFIVMVAGCTITRTSSFVDPSFQGKNFHRILVGALIGDIGERKMIEQIFSEQISKYFIDPVPSLEILMPTRTYSDTEISEILKEKNIDGVLLITLTDEHTTRIYNPPSFSTTHGYGTLSGNTFYYTGTTHNLGGGSHSKTEMKFIIQLFDASTFRTAWVATSSTTGEYLYDTNMLINSLVKSLIEKLKEDDFIPHKAVDVPPHK